MTVLGHPATVPALWRRFLLHQDANSSIDAIY